MQFVPDGENDPVAVELWAPDVEGLVGTESMALVHMRSAAVLQCYLHGVEDRVPAWVLLSSAGAQAMSEPDAASHFRWATEFPPNELAARQRQYRRIPHVDTMAFADGVGLRGEESEVPRMQSDRRILLGLSSLVIETVLINMTEKSCEVVGGEVLRFALPKERLGARDMRITGRNRSSILRKTQMARPAIGEHEDSSRFGGEAIIEFSDGRKVKLSSSVIMWMNRALQVPALRVAYDHAASDNQNYRTVSIIPTLGTGRYSDMPIELIPRGRVRLQTTITLLRGAPPTKRV
jgi:hypothetical protein